ncbi:putative secondary metabolism biosynthetic enzyme [Curvularia kusanoi]|uniref:gluconokinase n=1 Tax=Curvularia kusanoi TaxID=90978 RepID=A0A9P4W202_CURKU|nr:putative secondary metabolism biosynthetic enzyme [Curvularia kusanoi]
MRTSSDVEPTTVALLGPSNFEYAVTMLALTKLGHTVLLLSTRIPQLAIESLIETTGATHLLADGRFLQTASDVQANMPSVHVEEIAKQSSFDFPIELYADTRLDYQLDHNVEASNNVFIIHSSGSTGLPKPIYQPQKSCIANYAIHMDMKAFITLPLYHNHGICNFFRAIYSGKSIHIYNADLPLTQPHLTSILRQHKFEIFYGVPYALKLLAETDEGIALLQQLEIIMYGGSACPDALGNLLVENGVKLVGHYGATEVGQLMTSFRPDGDNAWNYVRESPKLQPFLKWIPQGTNLYECTVLPGWPSKVASNRPDGSYATKDLFEPHPTIERAWKYVARLDDTIVLVNGEKFNPVMMEGMIRSHKAVTETVIFGTARPYLGMLVVPSPATCGMSNDGIIDQIWSVIEEANRNAEAYARITRHMIHVLPHDCQFPRTDKGSIIRQAFYKQFAPEIENAYDLTATSQGDVKTFEIAELESFIRAIVAKSLPRSENLDRSADFFSLGLDSLQAILIRTEIMKNVDIGGNKLGQNVVFEYPSISALSAHLHGLRTGTLERQTSVEQTMQDLLQKYNDFTAARKQTVVLTGATGSLGAHVLAQLVSRADVETVYCLVRAKNENDAARRVTQSLLQRKIYHTLSLGERAKIFALPSDFSDVHLGLSSATYESVAERVTNVIHCAWAVNFNWGLKSFEKDCIAGVNHLINLCLAHWSSKATFDFCSSVSTVAKCPEMNTPERVSQFEWAQDMGYAQSKCVAEHLCMAAAQRAGVKARVLRVGQIVADTIHGVWNKDEAIPLILQSALTIGALPKLQENPSWTPVDVIAKAVTEISFSNAGAIVANVTNAKTFSWTGDLLPALRQAGLDFDEVEPKEWIKRLRNSSEDVVANPTFKLVEFFASKYDKETFGPMRTYETAIARQHSPALDDAPVLDASFVRIVVDQFRSDAWEASSPALSKNKHQVIVIAGPCGSGKSTISKHLSATLKAPFVEGDELHSFSAITQMTKGIPLGDDDRVPWLDRLKKRALETIHELEYEKVIVSCSALNKQYRDRLRTISSDEVQVIFIDLQVEKEELVRRLQRRDPHYMKSEMIESQMAIYSAPSIDEVDVLPVDAGKAVEDVIKDVETLLEMIGK